MKKSLLLATMFLSGVVQAESFVCETGGWASIHRNGAQTQVSEAFWIVNSEKGWKYGGSDDYSGVCEFVKLGERDALECKNTEGPFPSGDIHRFEFTIWLGSNNDFVKLNRYAGSVDVSSGSCTKI